MTTPVDDPADAFDVLGDETRLSILRALADAEEPLSFTRLRERCGVADSGRFSYHLRRLCEYFVRETERGYELGHAGSRVVTTAGESAGRQSGSDDGADTGECPVCGDEGCEKLFHVHLSAPWRGG